jgi:hypothetical protein
MEELENRRSTNYWNIAHGVLLTLWIVGAALTMAQVRGGFLTNYLSDLAFPPYFYIVIRGLHGKKIPSRLLWFSKSPERAAFSIFVVGVVSEVAQKFLPKGPFGGTYDPIDIVLFGTGLLVCYCIDKWKS